ncbi:MAG: GHKL domain-containing protein [Bacteroidetes bacterium]|jgi:K+-sensing histidine kinase KdpD|nr:GHKL domain-containing protein [Bacteroidota bacterium]HMT35966.1 ATP-binding protein [Chitinophagaceae bacterium]MBK6820357.1 GHKL domain-containing protein [Bacteroidota bacterium]MBK7041120.1 GHKL domain-containing protein [Bacteroidota bacterium]MBK7587718.1 GHKL domain-containing protein [Bacteroidota bacterium]
MKFTIAYTLLLIYVVAAIIFWGYSLNKQGNVIFELEKEKITLQQSNNLHLNYDKEFKSIQDKKIKRTKQFLGEGSTFLLIILLSASIVYYAYYRQRKLSKLQQNFMLSVTHELKTPIAGIKLNMQTLEKRKLDEDIQMKLIKSSVNETNRLNDLCNNILIATQLENTSKAIYTEDVSLEQILSEVIDEMRARYRDLKIALNVYEEDKIIRGDATIWKLVISNLIENARKYSPKDEPIVVEMKQVEGKTLIAVIDRGNGIPDTEKKKIFEKFYRIGNENTRSSKGTGLGLFIVKKIIKMYKYDISVKNNIPKGSIFEVTID